ncbi:MAG TPA: Xaa-Pro dipeptidyl-peptidase [Gemmatimonadales bacterium]|nr:Xaa-Pro dipeptidyl-peptidase [Gemmatimonadales bacterium]
MQPILSRTVLAIAALASATSLAAQGRGRGGPPPVPPVSAIATLGHLGPIIKDGMLEPVSEYADTSTWIKQRVWVETGFDSDHDGKPDRVHVDLIRPGAAEKAGVKLPVIMKASPYLGRGQGNVDWNVDQELGDAPPHRTAPAYTRPFAGDSGPIRASYANEWVPRSLIAVDAEQVGTGLSTGCPTSGDTPERVSAKYVIDWLNGRAKGYTTVDGNVEVKATAWTNGRVGMYGTSYEGAMPMATATTGVEGLEAIIPISPNTSDYRYYRSFGLVRSPGSYLGEDIDVLYDFVHSGRVRERCDSLYRDGDFAQHMDRAHGDFSDFWKIRDQTQYIKNVKAAVLFAHGFNDWNVMPDNTIRMWDALKKINPKTKIYMSQGGHGAPPPADIQNKWWAHYLYGVKNGVDTLPRAMIVQSTAVATGGGRAAAPPKFFADYPVPGSAPITLHPAKGGSAVGTLTFAAAGKQGVEKLTDDWQIKPGDMAQAASSPNRLIYALPVLKDSIHMSGYSVVTLKLALSKPAANLSVYLVTLPFDPATIGSTGQIGVVTRGWADPQNYQSLKDGGDFTSTKPGVPLVPGKFYTMTFPLQPDDQIIKPGQQLALMILSSDNGFTLRPKPGTEITVDLDGSSITIPVVGGSAALKQALGAH